MLDDNFMSIALKLAEKNLGNVAPNPAVGCIIVKDNVVVGEGYTEIGGRPHAEVVALQNAKGLASGATMYVTLEPCCHHGVTGPCTSEIIDAGIKRVVIATIDPDERVLGSGIKILQEAGIEVTCGIMQEEAEKLNIGFFTTQKLRRPFITCKIASTLDGKIATFAGESKWITSEDTRNWVHELRAKYDAIMIGSNTLVNDDPLLTCRLPGLEDRSPIRLIIDSQDKLKEGHNIAKTASPKPTTYHSMSFQCSLLSSQCSDTGIQIPASRAGMTRGSTWVITNKEVKEKIRNIHYLVVSSNNENKVCLKSTMSKLVSEIGITRLLVEGGGILITELLKHNLIDRLIICRSGKILGNDATPFIANLGIESINQCYKFKKAEIIDFSDDVVEVWDKLP
ncbi:bifunctional diaminohydroxyphosphoribosylaminopyrimidine deaminase/5-amino-6-(5-phosphoribosylamino)uracil reductase RibD [Wolbachia endosymbiont of Folsomia candida]|uniref:bifunctional diaminohydroxyphosphoribosylaminopyrimidine deaminase/5-amino-6-(5-phosphoribosylamino)uracil reductase RibD n=1 Tax=Wolbachia endosymbiont of Folsomia candida TaxID=169402 RepID=UPI000B2C2884|nr:bifunctional diaminohydroxyphosphoribosylaminopyrimidine deaminase/5-amino-6-(5-phosphoribosylamino)uracil reductase RibD [Wolbachia endosymbiont of Folsomia candida]APR98125.1 bifunctional diaminohydroxyphosphoribosylaminopyrimidine deaminase/5-amino-6-(5-phosphoribosylamino)uracil reductase RibD [Wolbachia endosymbiont of Folsomia candida]